MLKYLLISLALVPIIRCNPIQIQSKKRSPLVYLTPSSSQYVPNNMYPFAQQTNEPAQPFAKALQSFQSPNDILFYPNSVPFGPQPIYVNTQPQGISTISPAGKFTAPPSGLINAIYAWFAENNLAAPDDPAKNDVIQEKIEIRKNQEKIVNREESQQASETDVTEIVAEKNAPLHYSKKSVSSKFNPGHRFYILNGQPQFYSNYQALVPRLQPVISQLFTRNSVPTNPQNILILQPQHEHQQPNINLKNMQSPQNLVLLRNNMGNEPIQSEYIKPVGYHGANLKPQNYVLVRSNQPQNEVSQIQYQPTYSREQVLIGRLLPQSHNIKHQHISQTPIHQTHYVPVEVVPPQVPLQTAQYHFDNQAMQQENLHQHLSFIHIPVDSNIQPPQYIKPLVPLPINAKSELPPLPLLNQQQSISASNPFIYLSPGVQQSDSINSPFSGLLQQQEHESQQNIHQEQQNPGQEQQEVNNMAALEIARYIASRHGDLYSDTVVIDAKSNDESKEQESVTDSLQSDNPEEPSVAQAQPIAVALAGTGGVASTAPRGTALVSDKGLAIASPHATAVAGPETNKKTEKLT